jgi:hypothetical protein
MVVLQVRGLLVAGMVKKLPEAKEAMGPVRKVT